MDNASSVKMTKALLGPGFPTRESINKDHNIYKMKSGRSFSLTMYARAFRCKAGPGIAQNVRCDHINCPADQLEKILHAFGCKDRFWDDRAGSKQPLEVCGQPPHITKAMDKEREYQAEQRRLAKEKAARDAEFEEEQTRLTKRIELEQRARKKERDDLQAERDAEAAERDRRRTDNKKEQDNDIQISKTRHNEAMRQRKALAEQDKNAMITVTEIETKARRAQAKMEQDTVREKKKLLDSYRDAQIQAQFSGTRSSGFVMGEVFDDRKRLKEK